MDNFMFFVVLFAGIGLGFAFGYLYGSYWSNAIWNKKRKNFIGNGEIMAIEKCKNCIHWERVGELEKGLCGKLSTDFSKPKPKYTRAYINILCPNGVVEFNTHESFFCRLFEINKKNFE